LNPSHSLSAALTLAAATALSLAAPRPARADETPACVAECKQMAAKNELKDGVNEKGCVVNVCQQAARQEYREGRYEQSLATLTYLDKNLARSPSFLLDRGLAYYALGRFELALKDFDGVLAGYSDSFQGGAQRAHTLMRLHRLEDARAQFDKLRASKAAQSVFRGLGTDSYLLGNIGVIDLIDGQKEKGLSELDQALKSDGRNTLASTYLYRVAPQLDAKTIDKDGVLLLLGASEDVGLDRRLDADKEIRQVIQKYPKFPETYFLAAEFYRNWAHYEDCEALLLVGEKAIPAEVDLKAERLRCTLLKDGPTSDRSKATVAELKKLSSDHPESALARDILKALDL
jgi:tetratricopeptide (TPR) repeat protein